MSRLRFLAVLLLLPALASAGTVATFAAQEGAARTAARAYSADLCKQTPAACAEAKSLLAGYESALDSATACNAGGCKLEAISRQAKELVGLDRRDSALPPPPTAAGRPFLALSAIAASRLTAAASRLGNAYAASTYSFSDPAAVLRSVEAACLDAAASCASLRAIVSAQPTRRGELEACDAEPCPLERVDRLIESAKTAMSDYLGLSKFTKVDTLSIFSVLNEDAKKGIALYTPLADQAAADFDKGTRELGAKLDAAEKNASAQIAPIDAAGRDLFEGQRRATLTADRLLYHLGYDPKDGAGARRETVNASVVRLAGLRTRALALRTARGLADDKGASGAVPGGTGAGGTASPKPGVVLSESAKTVIDRRLVPSPSGSSGGAPPIVPGDPSFFKLQFNAFSSDPLVRADAQRRLGRTRTVGDPAKYAPAAFRQADAASCAVAVQAQILQAHGLLPPGQTAASAEQALITEARARGFMKDGSPPEYNGSLLTERGMTVVKSRKKDQVELEAAIKRGSVIQAGVDADIFWDLKKGKPEGHSIIVTGAEIAKSGGSIVGVYVNDSGSLVPGAARFIPWSKFLKSWRGNMTEVR